MKVYFDHPTLGVQAFEPTLPPNDPHFETEVLSLFDGTWDENRSLTSEEKEKAISGTPFFPEVFDISEWI